MSIQDDIFDVEAVLEGKPEAESFDRIRMYLIGLEQAHVTHKELLNDLGKGFRAQQIIKDVYGKS